MRIIDGKVSGVAFRKAKYSGGPIKPRQIILHDTAGSLRKFSSVEWFATATREVSAHFVVERDGTVTQMVPLNRKAFHAGVSRWKGQSGLNSSAIGIEIVNPGKLDASGNADFGPCCKPHEITHKRTAEHGDGYWLPYTDAQIAAVKLLCALIVEEYPECNEILTHYEVSPGRKIDVNPLFPLREVRKAVLDPAPDEPAPIETAPPPPEPVTSVPAVAKAKTAAKSWSVRWIVTSILAWVETKFGFVRDALPDAKAAYDEVADPLTSLFGALHQNWDDVLIVVAVCALLVALYRHTNDRHELNQLKGA